MMIDSLRALCEQSLRTRGTADTLALMNSRFAAGLTFEAVDNIRRAMVKRGELRHLSRRKTPDCTDPSLAYHVHSERAVGAYASQRLLRRQLETGQHTISCPDLMARALREAGMAA